MLLYERGFAKKPKAYELLKYYSPYAFLGATSGQREKTTYQDDMKLMHTFYRKYPEAKYFPHGTTMETKFGGALQITHPAAVFIKKQRSLMNKGYTEEKAF